MVGPFEMSGQIDYPSDDDIKFPTVLIIPGMPQHDRYGNVKGYPGYNNYFVPLTKSILDAGYAVFRYDKGGVGKSSSGISASENLISAYRKMVSLPRVNNSKIALLGIGGGSAQIYRKWMELVAINPVEQITLLSTGVNDLKLEQFNLPICLITGEGRTIRSKRALEKYSETKGQKVVFHEVEGANEQLCRDENDQASLFKENGCEWHEEALNVISNWFSSFVS